jgi:hypothetical protein
MPSYQIRKRPNKHQIFKKIFNNVSNEIDLLKNVGLLDSRLNFAKIALKILL